MKRKYRCKTPVHNNVLDNIQRAILCHNYAVKGIQLRYIITALDLSIISSLINQNILPVSVIAGLINRSKVAVYAVCRRCIDSGIIEQVGVQKRYRLTLLGIEVYNSYLANYAVMAANLDKLEDMRIERMQRKRGNNTE